TWYAFAPGLGSDPPASPGDVAWPVTPAGSVAFGLKLLMTSPSPASVLLSGAIAAATASETALVSSSSPLLLATPSSACSSASFAADSLPSVMPLRTLVVISSRFASMSLVRSGFNPRLATANAASDLVILNMALGLHSPGGLQSKRFKQ